MRTEHTDTGGAAEAYESRPWIAQYPADVPPSISYPHSSLWGVLQETVSAYGNREAFVFQGSATTFRELSAEAERMAAALWTAGVRKGDVVLLVLPNVPHFPVMYYAAARLGAVLAAITPTSVTREIENALRDSGARTLVTLDILFESAAPLRDSPLVDRIVVGTVVDLMPLWKRMAGRLTGRVPAPKVPVTYDRRVIPFRRFIGSGKENPPQIKVTPEDVALLQYTGGTTGLPKAATLTHGSLIANARQMLTWFPQLRRGEETILAVLPFFHVYGVTLAMNAGLLLAARTVLIPRPSTGDIFEAIRAYRPTIFPGVPTLYVALINDARSTQFDLSSIDVCVSGGAPLPLEVKRDFEKLTGGHLYEGYGLSEASPLTHAQPYDGRSKIGSMGLPVPDTDARIVDEDGRPVPIGEEGELVVRGPQVMQGYWNRPEETAAVLRDGWLRTGDIARMDEEGWFYIVDRKKDLIITGGENIYPREVEEVLFEHPKVLEAAVVGVPHPFGGEIAKAFIVLKPGETATKREITQFAAERLAKHKVPRAVEFRDSLPKSEAQKVLRRVLAEEEYARQATRPARRRPAGVEVDA